MGGDSQMAGINADFSDCTVFIYDEEGNHINDTVVTSHDRISRQLQVEVFPEELKINDRCKLFILSSPSPCEFKCKVKKAGGNTVLALYQGSEKENRAVKRYMVSTGALINALYCDGQSYPLQTPVKVELINISRAGVRFRAPFFSFQIGDMFQIDLVVKHKRRELAAEVINFIDNEPKYSDYGCQFVNIFSIT